MYFKGHLTIAVVVIATGVLTACSGFDVWPISSGRTVYHERCAICHGPGGKGDGDFADELIKRPTDLTALARNNDGVFPRLRVSQAIDGYGRGSHFSAAMPDFGPLLVEGAMLESGDGVVTPAPKQLVAVVAYLESIQK